MRRFTSSIRPARARIRDASEAGCAPRRGVVVRVAPDPLETDAGCGIRQAARGAQQAVTSSPNLRRHRHSQRARGLRKPSAPRQDEALVGALRRHGGGRRPRGAAVVVAPPPGPNPTPATTSQHPTVGPEPTWTVDEAIDEIGFGPFQLVMLCVTGLAWMGDAMEMMLLSFLGPAARCEWGISPRQEACSPASCSSGCSSAHHVGPDRRLEGTKTRVLLHHAVDLRGRAGVILRGLLR